MPVLSPLSASQALASAQDAVEALRAAVEAGVASAGELMAVTEDLHRLGIRIQALHTHTAGRVAHSGAWGEVGFRSAASWLRATHLIDHGQAARVLRTSRWLDDQPEVATAYADGSVSESHVAAIRTAVNSSETRTSKFGRFARDIVTAASNTDPQRTRRIMRAWADTVDPATADDESDHDDGVRRLYLSPLGRGWDLKGWLPEAEGAELAGILNEIMERRYRTDSQTASAVPVYARRADALMDLARAAASGDLSQAARDRARVVVHVPLTDLSEAGGDAEPRIDPGDVPHWCTGNGPGAGSLAPADLARLTCDAQIQRLVVDPSSVPLDIGRATRVVPPGIRAAVQARDGGCVIPGCDRPPGWCEAHHIQHWSQGGSTSAANLALLCARHHKDVHRNMWVITGHPDRHPSVRRC